VTLLNERIPLERISAQAKEVQFSRTLITVIAFFFYAIGWTVAKLWLSLAWCAVAIKVGFEEGKVKRDERIG
jgi:hypothetical protein